MKDRFFVSEYIHNTAEDEEDYAEFNAYPSDLPLDFTNHPAAALEGFRSVEDNAEQAYLAELLEDSKGG